MSKLELAIEFRLLLIAPMTNIKGRIITVQSIAAAPNMGMDQWSRVRIELTPYETRTHSVRVQNSSTLARGGGAGVICERRKCMRRAINLRP